MSQKEFIMVILGVCTVVYPLINNFYKKAYQISCEKFYGLPGKYFDSNIDTRLWYVGGILVLLLTQTSHIKMCLCTLKIQ